MSLYKTQGIVIGGRDFGEADKILIVFSLKSGKIIVIAKGVRRPLARFSGHLELFSYSDFLFAEGRTFDIITAADNINLFLKIRADLKKTALAFYFCEICDKILPDTEKNEEIFWLLLKALNVLDKSHFTKPVMQYLTSYFILQLLERSGFGPNFNQCVNCLKKMSEIPESSKLYFSPQDGGIVCEKCAINFNSNQNFPIGKNSIKVIRLLTRGDINLIQRLPKGESLKTLEFAELYLNNIVEKPLSSPKFLKRVQEF